MTESWFVYIIIFILVSITAQQLQRGLREFSSRRRDRHKRFNSLLPPTTTNNAIGLRRRSSRLGRSVLALRVTKLIRQSGTHLSPSKLCFVGLGLVLVLYFLLPASISVLLRLLTGIIGSVSLLGLWLQSKRARRMRRFGEQLPEVIEVIVRSLRAGHPLAVSLNLVAREMFEPAGPEFALVVDEVNYGRSLDEALYNLYERVGYPELRFLIASTAIAHQTGGNLSEILSRLSRMLRERFRLARRVRALSSEGRFSGYALSILPIALFGLINFANKSYYAEFWTSAAATPVLAVSIGLLVSGNLIIYRLVNFRV